MPDITITLANGRRITFPIHEHGPGPQFLLGVRKSGSSILNNICRALALKAGRNFVAVGDTFFGQNVVTGDWVSDPALRQLIQPGNIYGGFRDMPLALQGHAAFDAAPKLIMVRDPRDALVSEYFSNAFSHSIPDISDESDAVASQMLEKRQQALAQRIGAYVLEMAPAMNDTMVQYATLAAQPQTLVVKYEDMIFDKPTLIAHLGKQFELPVHPAHAAQILGWADKRPFVEDPQAFIRKVRPGDHREKLDAGTINQLNALLHPAMTLFGYRS